MSLLKCGRGACAACSLSALQLQACCHLLLSGTTEEHACHAKTKSVEVGPNIRPALTFTRPLSTHRSWSWEPSFWALCAAPIRNYCSDSGGSTSPCAPPRSPYLAPAAEVLAPLLEGRPFVVAKLPGRGRGLVASCALHPGQLVHLERPLLAFPALEGRGAHQVCYHCLAARPLGAGMVRHPGTGRRFCGAACLQAALRSYLAVEQAAWGAEGGGGSRSGNVAAAGGGGGGGGGNGALAELYEECRQYGERFPLMAARLAFMHVSEAARQHLLTARGCQVDAAAMGYQPAGGQCSSSGASGASGGGAGGGDTASLPSSVGPSKSVRPSADVTSSAPPSAACSGDPLRSLHVLCHANVPPPLPGHWVRQHALLAGALRAMVADAAASAAAAAAQCEGGGGPLHAVAEAVVGCQVNDVNGSAAATAVTMTATATTTAAAGGDNDRGLEAAVSDAVQQLTVEWHAGVLSRLHLNVFQVHNPLAGADPSDLAAAAAALVSNSAGGNASAGSAVYLAASLLNHSCNPALDMAFPHADGTAAFTATRHIQPGEELTVSYLDVSLPYDVRRKHLEWSYGFVCGCARCVEDAAEAGVGSGSGA